MKNRIKEVRKYFNLTQTDFGIKVGVKGNTITNYETGLRTPSDSVILSICREFNVNENWLRTGDGDMFVPQTRSEKIAEFAGSLMREEDSSFKKRLIEALARLDEKDWEVLEGIAKKALKKD